LVVFAATVISLVEYFTMVAPGDRAERVSGVVLGAGLAATLYWVPSTALVAVAMAAMAMFSVRLLRPGELATVGARTGQALLGLVYVAVLLTTVALLKREQGGRGGAWVFVALTIAWLGDSGAYFAGRALGRRKLSPQISPGKTVEGAVGGLLASLTAVAVAKLWYLPSLGWVDVPLLALPAAVLGQLGDLCESMLKRAHGVKDSGNLLPGHGGMLDRIDGLMFVAPYVYAYARWKT
jgi:phosphatidate cytidylyltransferase